MIFEIMQYLHNFFETPDGYHSGTFTIQNGVLNGASDYLVNNQFYRIVGSTLNDGVYQFGIDTLNNESFEGAVIAMAVPPSFKSLCDDIKTWQQNSGSASAMQSESFGGYSYSRKFNSDGSAAGWQQAFGSRLKAWRKL